ncbi:hypothetical protein ACE7GA_15870 [Roseomonas sp. CCTCC AB2023176]|uniref:hypothetical protein n=1 Tax=Roseomonas sp. CCTCC AB2023176 TaxID=3342640 RepID=UPI0035E33A5F
MVGWAPILSVIFTGIAADALGCRVNEGGVTPCTGPGGTDWGPLLYTTGMMGWFMLVTWPLILATTLLWAVLLIRGVGRLVRR